MEKSTAPTPTPPPPPTPKTRKWYHLLTLDLFLHTLSQTLFHPFIAWILVLCLRAVATPTHHPSFVIATSWAAFLTVFTALRYLNHRLADGPPRRLRDFAHAEEDVAEARFGQQQQHEGHGEEEEEEEEEEVIVITGGASGLGRSIAHIYGMRGASVAVLDVRDPLERQQWEQLSGVEYYQCDIGDRRAVEGVAKRIEADVRFLLILDKMDFYFADQIQLGKPSVLINCAAAPVHGVPLVSLSADAWSRTMRTNLLGPFHMIRAFLPHMLRSSRGGVIVNVSSVLAHLTPAGLSDYSASKAALSALHRSLEAEIRAAGQDHKVKTILVEPGQLATPLFDGIETPNHFFAPVVEPIHVAKEIVAAIDAGKGGVIRQPTYAAWVNWYAVLPASIQRFARYLSGIDRAVANSALKKTIEPQAVDSSTAESETDDTDKH